VLQLPALFVLGRCCLRWAQQAQSYQSLAVVQNDPFVPQFILPSVQQWLQASSTHEQLVAAGYAPQAVPHCGSCSRRWQHCRPFRRSCATTILEPVCWPYRAGSGVRAQLCLWGLPCGALLWPGQSAVCMEAARAGVRSTGSCNCNKGCSSVAALTACDAL
jgi:hypothetical protein